MSHLNQSTPHADTTDGHATAATAVAVREWQLTALAELAETAARTDDARPVMDLTVRRVAELIRADVCDILERDAEGGLTLRACFGYQTDLMRRRIISSSPRSLPGFVFRSSAPVISHDVPNDDRFEAPILERLGIHSIIALPIAGLDGPVGIIGAHSRARNMFTQADAGVLRGAAGIVGLVLDRRRADGESIEAAGPTPAAGISDSRRIGNVPRAAQSPFEQLAANIDETFWLTSADERVLYYVSPAYERITGLSVESLHADPTSWIAALHPQDRAPFEETLRRRGSMIRDEERDNEVRVVTPGGDTRWIWMRSRPIRDADGRIVSRAGMAIDITDRKRIEHVLRASQARLRLLETELAHVARVATVGEMSAAIAHELNQPLAAIANYSQGCESILAAGAMDRVELLELVSNISRLTLRAAKIVDRVRNFVRYQATEPVWIDLNELVNEVVDLAEPQITNASITVRLALQDDLPPVRADPIQLQQVVLNLIRNAVSAVDEVTGVREILIRTERAEGGSVATSVTDTGPGVPPGQVETVFDPFVSTKSDGLGLGLAISRSIIEAHGGTLATVGESRRGATFRFTIPIDQEETRA